MKAEDGAQPVELTFVVTDVVGSTRAQLQLGDRYSGSLRLTREALSRAFSARRVLAIRTEGDAVLAAFQTPGDAVAAAVAGQLALLEQGETLSVRTGVHTGEARLGGGGYVGAGVTGASSVGAAARGGQILVSEALRTEMGDRKDLDGLGFTEAGEVRLKAFDKPQTLFQVTYPGLPDHFPKLGRSHVALPTQATSFVGRTADIKRIVEMLSGSHSIITLIGPGGTGKTRLALEVAAEKSDDFPDGVWFLDLAALNDPELVPVAAAHVAGVAEVPGRPLAQSIADHLKTARCLLVMDNFEHLKPAIPLISQMVSGCPGAKILVTTRETLGIDGELVYPVAPLSTENTSGSGEPVALTLFRQRAEKANPNLVLSEDDRAVALGICQRVDGLPLAIELAAARVRVLSVGDIAESLSQRLPLLTGGSRDLPERQRTLSAAIEWSYDLLNPEEADFFAFLAIFVGGFDVAAAGRVWSDFAGHAETETSGLIDSLVNKSLLSFSPSDGRFTFLQTVHDFARDQLSGRQQVEKARDAHARYYASLADTLSPSLISDDQLATFETLDSDVDNFRSAFACLHEHWHTRALQLMMSVWWFWITRGIGEWIRWYEGAPLDDDEVDPDLRARVLVAAAVSCVNLGNIAGAGLACAKLEALVPLCTQKDRWTAWLEAFGSVAARGDKDESLRLAGSAISHARGTTEPWELGTIITIQGEAFRAYGEYPKAANLYREANDIWERTGDRNLTAVSRSNLGGCSIEMGEYLPAIEILMKGLLAAKELKNDVLIANYAAVLGCAVVGSGETEAGVRLIAVASGWLTQRGWGLGTSERKMVTSALGAARAVLGENRVDELLAALSSANPLDVLDDYGSQRHASAS